MVVKAEAMCGLTFFLPGELATTRLTRARILSVAGVLIATCYRSIGEERVSAIDQHATSHVGFVAKGSKCEIASFRLSGLMSPPRPIAAIIEDHRVEPRRIYILRVGERAGDVEVMQIDAMNKAVMLRMRGATAWVGYRGVIFSSKSDEEDVRMKSVSKGNGKHKEGSQNSLKAPGSALGYGVYGRPHESEPDADDGAEREKARD